MTVTIGSFTCNLLTVQPFGYEGEARTGLTARTFQISGLLTAAQWQDLLSEYDAWRDTRINDQDTLLSESVGTTINLTTTPANGISVTSLPCWFVEPPSGDQTGTYVSANVLLVDAAEALEVILRERELAKEREIAEAQDVDCAVIAANLQRQKDETDCELTALEGGLADDFAEQQIRRQKIDAEAREAAYGTLAANVEDAKTADIHVDLLDRQATVAGQTTYGADLAAVDIELQSIETTARETAYDTEAATIETTKTAEIHIDLLDRQATVAGQTLYGIDLASVDIELRSIEAVARDAAYVAEAAYVETTKTAEIHIELLEKQASIAGQTLYAELSAEADIELQSIEATGREAAYDTQAAFVEATKTAEIHIDLLDRQATVAGQTLYGVDLATVDIELQSIEATARETAYVAEAAALETTKTAEIHVELLDKQASIAGQTLYAADLAAADLELQALAETGKATAYATDATSVAALQGAAIDIELLEYAAKVTALTTGSRLANLKTARALDAVYEKYINEDLPNLGTVTLGSATITLIQPMDTRSDGPQVALTASGSSYITGPLVAHETRQINGHVTSGSYANVLSWYDTTISSVPGSGTWFPVSGPTATAEPFLIAGAKSTRYTVTVEVKKII